MIVTDLFSASSIALYHKEVASNKLDYLGKGLFPPNKKMGLDLSWLKTSKGLAVPLEPSNFDALPTLRSRSGVEKLRTEMPFFREAMVVSESDQQEIIRVQDSTDPYAQAVINHIYRDVETLVEAAEVVPERMIMQLLSAEDGSPKIYIESNGVKYAYNYDPDGTYQQNNFLALSGSDAWTAKATANPFKQMNDARKKVNANTGTMPSIAIMTQATFDMLLENESVRNSILAHNSTAIIEMDDATVKSIIKKRCNVDILIYDKMYKDENGQSRKFYPDNYVTLIPKGTLGNTWYGTTPEERTLMSSKNNAEVSIVGTGIAVAVTTTDKAPIQTQTTVSEIVLPSYERMDETFVMKVA